MRIKTAKYVVCIVHERAMHNHSETQIFAFRFFREICTRENNRAARHDIKHSVETPQ